jgi:hypothetical protein
MAGPTPLKVLRSTHPRLDPFYVRTLRALYKGGKTLLGDEDVMRQVFPKSTLESEGSYAERRARAFYDNDFALVINQISAGLAQDPLRFDDESGPTGTAPTAKKLESYWTEIQKDATPPDDDGPRKAFDSVIRETIVEGLVCEWGWILCDLPPPLEVEPGSSSPALSDQEAAGKLRAYPVPVPCDQVLNWNEKGGTIRWLRMYTSELVQDEPEQEPKWTRHTWKVWSATDVTTYQIDLDKEGKDTSGKKWEDDDVVSPIAEPALHSFGRVPWIRFDCGAPNEQSMHVGGMIESRCRSQFNQGAGEAYLRTRAMFQQLYEFLGPESSGPDREISDAQENVNRASKRMTSRAPDIVQIRGQDDDARFIGPEMSSAAINLQALNDGREAIPRITGQLALAADTTGAMVRRSGESKAQDKIAQEVLLGAVGKKGLAFGCGVADMLALGRGDAKKRPTLRGYEHFDVDDAAARVEEHVALNTAQIKSATFQIEHQLMVALAVLGDGVTPETKKQIRQELSETITQDSINQSNMPGVPPGHELDEDGMAVPSRSLPPKEPKGGGFGKAA